MYDRRELEPETDRLWRLLREAIRDRGIDAPEVLTRDKPLRLVWSAPELVFGQTCGLPYASALARRVGLIGTPAYAIDGVAPGEYRSALIVRADNPAADLGALAGARVAINARDSQSGYGALMHEVAPHVRGGQFFSEAMITGSHAASMEAVARGGADLAAIDGVTWALAERYDRIVSRLRVIAWSAPMPGLPYISGQRRHLPVLLAAAEAAIAALPAPTRDALLLTGIVHTRPETYDVIRTRLAAAHAVHRLPSPPH
ncbi:PhnD/SsuA/transferrin family substrate-binding protein [Paralimibaculum aggregatum]|uniref:PhnD/SsuA/transferrin family substrate-binding protein n=2 Tax=Paralimibaculum aggregatum TaxID=3036245 RepID=A0ABQ6LTP7_9RHOB|nr:PhnD/SsuA/transferrin family substrate-binding protein [Limibaculum sp. NKW23]